jgi:hypothetical protein
VTEQQAAPAARPATGPLSDQEQAYLARLTARRDAALVDAGAAVRMKVEGDHESLTYGGVTVGSEFTTVPVSMVAALVEAAADAGVTITQES